MMTDPVSVASQSRPAVSVIVPFFGDRAAGAATIEAIERLCLEAADEAIVVDNTPDNVLAAFAGDGHVRIVVASDERSSYHARNVGAMQASGEWLLFTDADCRPPPDLLEAFFRRPVPAETGVLAGAIRPREDEDGLLAEWAVTREILNQERSVDDGAPAAATACMMVRRSLWEALGGFQEGVRSGADLELCWRAADLGYRIELRPEAWVSHPHRETLGKVARQMARYAAGNAWQERRRPGSSPRPRALPGLARAVVGSAWYTITLRPRRAALKLVDGLAVAAQALGRGLGNSVAVAAPTAAGEGSRRALVVATDRFPVLSETFVGGEVAALRGLGWGVRVEAVAHPDRPALGGGRGLAVRYLEDEAVLGRLVATGWLLARHPLRAAADLLGRSRWPAQERLPLSAIAPQARRLAHSGERHVHVHFAALAAVSALRVGRLAGVPVSFTAHGHEVFATPRALREKIAAAAFVVAPCDYTAGHLRGAAPEGAARRVHTVVMGVDCSRFRRSTPYPGGRTVVAVGRLVEKKGFETLIDAAARLDGRSRAIRLQIAGEGPLRKALERRVEAAGLGERVELLGALSAAEVRDLLEEADLVAVPSVIAANGDRDAMPVVIKEALAMGVPVVGSDEAGLPEAIDDRWGALVPPRDSESLATAIEGLLALPPPRRGEMGEAGRAFVCERFSLRAQAERLSELIEASAQGRAGSTPRVSRS